MRICVDLDNTICSPKQDHETYSDVLPLEGAVETLQNWKADGHYIIISTARHMRTCDGDVSKIMAKVGKITLDWLEKYQIPYNEIHFGKPWADVYIDDKALHFKSWDEIKI